MYLREGVWGDEARGKICPLGKRRICWCPWPSQIQICCCFLTPASLGCLKCLFLLVCPLFFLVMYGFFFSLSSPSVFCGLCGLTREVHDPSLIAKNKDVTVQTSVWTVDPTTCLGRGGQVGLGIYSAQRVLSLRSILVERCD